MREDDDRTLIQKCLQGRTSAFEPLVDRYQRVLFNLALRMVGNLEDAKDITQTTFLKAFEHLSSYDPQHKFFSWIYRIAVNESLNLVNRAKPSEPIEASFVTEDLKPDEEYERQKLSEILQAAIMQLSPDHRQVIVLRHFTDLSYAEISSVVGVPERTVKSRLFEARRRLCRILLHRRAKT